MTVLDAYAIIATLAGEPAAHEVEPILRASDPPPAMSAVNLAEAIDKLVRRGNLSFDDVLERFTWLVAGGLEIVEADIEISSIAGFLRARYYDRGTRQLSLADCHALATALVRQLPIATSDTGLADVARTEDVVVVALPDSTGKRPT